MSNNTVFSEYAHYYDLLYKDKNYSAETEYLDKLIKKFNPNVSSILELGSGTGKHATLLTMLGYNVHGIERSQEMLNKAHLLTQEFISNNLQLKPPVFSEGDIRNVRVNEEYDAVISLFHVMSYQATNEDFISALRTARTHLKHNGLFIFDIWYGPAVLSDRPVVRIKRMIDETIEVTRLAEPVMHINDNLVDVNYHVFIRNLSSNSVTEIRESHLMRYLFKPEILLFSQNTGFQVVHCEEWLTGSPIDFNTWGACFILRAI